jgi:hypothetical protein
MATVQIELPDQLAQQAESAGLLSSSAIEEWLRLRLKAQSIKRLSEAARQMDAADDGEPITPEVAAAEIAAMRAEKRAARKL